MSAEQDEQEKPQKKRARKARPKPRRWIRKRSILFACLVILGPLALLLAAGKPISAPEWVGARVENTIRQSLAGGNAELGEIQLLLSDDFEPHVKVSKAAITDQTGLPIATLENITVELSRVSLLRGQIRPVSIDVVGASLGLRRDPEGNFDLSFQSGDGAGGASGPKRGSLADVLDSIDAVFDTPSLASIESVRAESVTFEYEDVRAARYWVATGGALELSQTETEIALRLGFQLLFEEGRTPAQIAMSFASEKGSARARFGANVRGLPASDFSTQAPAFAFLSVVDAPVSGAVRAEIGEAGELVSMDGALEFANGALRPNDTARPIRFNAGRAYFGFDPADQKISFNEMSFSTEHAEARAEGHAYLRDFDTGWPSTMLGQFRFSEIIVNAQDFYEDAVQFETAAFDFRLRLDPFTLDIGQALLEYDGARLRGDGQISVAETGWQLGLNLRAALISPRQLISLWPKTVVGKTRKWLDENVLDGTIENAQAVVRLVPGQEPRAHVSFQFIDSTVRFMNTLPAATNGAGFATISENAFALTIEQGEVVAPEGGVLNAAGTVLEIEDIRQEPPDMIVRLKAEGPIPAATSLLDLKPFNLFSDAGLTAQIAEGQAEVEAEILVPLIKDLQVEQVRFDVAAEMTDVVSDQLIEGRVLRSDRLRLSANNDAIEIGGEGTVGLVPFRARWQQNLGPDSAGQSRVNGTIELSQKFVEEFRIGLPDDAVSGQGRGTVEILLNRGQAPKFTLTSDLNQLAMRIPEIGWTLPAATTGELFLSGEMASPVRIDELRLSGAGLSALGNVRLNADGNFAEANFQDVQIGRWFSGPAKLTSRGPGLSPQVEVLGGRLDIRETTFGQGGGGGGAGGGQETPVIIALQRLIVSDGIEIHGFRGEIDAGPRLVGQFVGRVNGQASIRGALVQQENGVAVRVRSDDGGAVMRAAGIFEKAYDGEMELILAPRVENGQYNGKLTMNRMRVRGASTLADLLGAISVIGLLEQLNGQGIVFNRVEAHFRLTPQQVLVTRSSAMGPSLGVSMDGIYDLSSERLSLQGVISPLYVLNGIGQIFSRRGEGLFGFNYRIRGTADDPTVRVNPLSILTPGMFRDIFRTAPPVPQE